MFDELVRATIDEHHREAHRIARSAVARRRKPGARRRIGAWLIRAGLWLDGAEPAPRPETKPAVR